MGLNSTQARFLAIQALQQNQPRTAADNQEPENNENENPNAPTCSENNEGSMRVLDNLAAQNRLTIEFKKQQIGNEETPPPQNTDIPGYTTELQSADKALEFELKNIEAECKKIEWDAELIWHGLLEKDGKLYSGLFTGEHELFTGVFMDEVYKNGERLTGFYTDGLMYENGVKFSGEKDGKTFNDGKLVDADGNPVSATVGGLRFENGVVLTGIGSDGKTYSAGKPLNGKSSSDKYKFVNGVLVQKNGKALTSNVKIGGIMYTKDGKAANKVTISGVYYIAGKPANGIYNGYRYVNGVKKGKA